VEPYGRTGRAHGTCGENDIRPRTIEMDGEVASKRQKFRESSEAWHRFLGFKQESKEAEKRGAKRKRSPFEEEATRRALPGGSGYGPPVLPGGYRISWGKGAVPRDPRDHPGDYDRGESSSGSNGHRRRQEFIVHVTDGV